MQQNNMDNIYDKYGKIVHNYLLCLCRDAHIADELTQETFYLALKNIDSFKGQCKISSWLCQIGKNLWYKEMKKYKKSFDICAQECQNEMKSNENVETDCINHMEIIDLFKLLHNLEGKTKELMYLRLTGMLSFKEIGDILGESEVWARVNFYRTKQKIVKGAEKNE